MGKEFCIFCGNEPESKNREHVIPQWLIKMTGNPRREVYLGLEWTSPALKARKFSFNSYTLPACEKCNSACSHLEGEAKAIVEKIREHESLSASDWDVFLDWLDKVRTGLWLGMMYLNQNHRGLRPQFHINRRIGSKDRLLIIYEILDDGLQQVAWSGTESPIFQCMPSCFTLTINNFLFLSASHDCLISERFGFPFASVRKHRPEGGEWIEMEAGTETVRLPLIEKVFKTGGTQLFQPMIPYEHFRHEDGSKAECPDPYNSEYVRSNCMDYERGRGLIFSNHDNVLVRYPSTPSKDWIPMQQFRRGALHYEVGLLAGEYLEELFTNGPSFEDLPDEQKKCRESEVAGVLRLHRTMLDHFRNQRDMYY